MEVCTEAKRVMVHALSKMYSSRNQRGGISLHRSLLLTLVMRAARDAYHSARLPNHETGTSGESDASAQSAAGAESDRAARSVPAAHHAQTEELMDTAEAPEPPCAQQSDKRTLIQNGAADKENCNTTGHQPQSRKRRGKSGAEPDFLPCKKARLDTAELGRVLRDSSTRRNSGNCAWETESLSATHITRTIVTF